MASSCTDLTVVMGGAAGLGLQTSMNLLVQALRRAGYHLFATTEYMSRIRGGSNSIAVRVAVQPVAAPSGRCDLCLTFDRTALQRLRTLLGAEPLFVADPQHDDGAPLLPLPLQSLAQAAGGELLTNSVAAGFAAGFLGVALEPLSESAGALFAGHGATAVEQNLAALRSGWEYGAAQAAERGHPCRLAAPPGVAGRYFLSGTQALAFGAVAGGCNFMASYPMSPSTGVLTALAGMARDFGLVVEQAEDEIAAINMGLGSWYAGGRALVGTSGGGFDLMGEGLSLAGAIESPLVIHLAQRPGPATGLPTRTEQGDLEIARYSGHGEFPRAILAPGTLHEAYDCARHAFAMADACQVPVFLLTDQYLLEAVGDCAPLPLPEEAPDAQLIETGSGYRRYVFTESGVSPRGIPGHGRGLVCVDSDEHDEEGCITEDFPTRVGMVDKRLRKERLLREEWALPPRRFGPEGATRLLVGWGSNCEIVREALLHCADPDTAFLHCPQVHPLPAAVAAQVLAARRLIVVENNATGQFARMLRQETGRQADACWLKYDGLPFTVAELLEKLQQEVRP